MKDPYQVLGVDHGANQSAIKKAYRQLAKDLHPDLHPGDKRVAERFKDITAAYNLLGDEKMRRRYDRGQVDAHGNERMGAHFRDHRTHAGADQGAPFGFGGTGPFGGAEDLFAQLFSGLRRGGRSPRDGTRGGDRSYTVEVSFLDAVSGGRRRITLSDGKTLDVDIPAGIEEGQTIRLRAQGVPGSKNGTAGDALLKVRIVPHPVFTRKHDNIHVEVPVTLPEAVLGAKIDVPTIDGPVSMTIPKGSNSGAVLRLKGRGLVRRGSKKRGDQFVKLVVKLPDEPDEDMKKFAKDWGGKHGYDVRSKLFKS